MNMILIAPNKLFSRKFRNRKDESVYKNSRYLILISMEEAF